MYQKSYQMMGEEEMREGCSREREGGEGERGGREAGWYVADTGEFLYMFYDR